MRHVAANFLTVLIVLAVVVAGVVAWGAKTFRADGPAQEATQVVVAPGETLAEVSAALAENGVIADARIFRLGARYKGLAGRIQAGEFEVPAGASMEAVLQCLVDQSTCRRVTYSVTLVEGWTSWQAVEALKAAEFLSGEIDEVPPEGALAPDTYEVNRGDGRADLIERMESAQALIVEKAWAERAEGLPFDTPQEALVLASIVEKETGVADERRRVAAVFVNRLRRGMKLQTDPTVIYGLTQGKGTLGRGLRRSELDKPTPWNTYLVAGLPPTPIANPGRASIEAALNPADTDDLFFVADGSGGHVFSSTLREHNRNVRAWRRIEAERKKN